MTLDSADRARLLALARQSVATGRGRNEPAPPPPLRGLSAPLRVLRASFVTLRLEGRLRGCRGALEATQPLAHDVWDNAWASAFDDPRFPLLEASDDDAMEIGVSVLSRLQPVPAATRVELLSHIEPGRHGLILGAGPHRATFLPQVWESLPEPDDFLDRLLAKAGLPTRPWSPQTRAWRYTAESFDRAS